LAGRPIESEATRSLPMSRSGLSRPRRGWLASLLVLASVPRSAPAAPPAELPDGLELIVAAASPWVRYPLMCSLKAKEAHPWSPFDTLRFPSHVSAYARVADRTVYRRRLPDDAGGRQALPAHRRRTHRGSSTQHVSSNRSGKSVLHSQVLPPSIGSLLGAPYDVYLDEHNVYQPDILYLTHEHAARIQHEGIHGAPDLVVEILSPSTAGLDRRKREHFAAAGTVEFWQVDPAVRQIQRFVFAENQAKPVALIDEPETFTSPMFPDLTLLTAEIFRR